MKKHTSWQRLLLQEDLNFLLTNRIPRITLTRWMGRLSRIESPLFAALCIRVWRLFTHLDLSDAATQPFNSLHACFTRALKPGSRVFDARPQVLTSPSDGIVGALGTVTQGTVFQAKGFPYLLTDLLGCPELAAQHEGWRYLTIRLTSSMYHRFHSPIDGLIRQLHYISGDTWNVNPIALKRVERLFCKNERAVVEFDNLQGERELTLVPVAAVLVASMRFHFANAHLHLDYAGPHRLACHHTAAKGEELGWFEHGSTIIVLVHPRYQLHSKWQLGSVLRAGQALYFKV